MGSVTQSLSQEGKYIEVLENLHEHFMTCPYWAPIVARDEPPVSGASPGQNGQNNWTREKNTGVVTLEEQLCFVTTGSADLTIKIFAT